MKIKGIVSLIVLIFSFSLFVPEANARIKEARSKIIMKKDNYKKVQSRSFIFIPFEVYQTESSIIIEFVEPYEDMVVGIYNSNELVYQIYISVSQQKEEIIIPIDRGLSEKYTLELSTLSGESWFGNFIK